MEKCIFNNGICTVERRLLYELIEKRINMEKCIFDNNINCKHFTNNEYRCIIFKQKCDILESKYRTEIGISTFGDAISLTFKGND